MPRSSFPPPLPPPSTPPGASTVNPLTTVVQSIINANPSISLAAASATVAAALGLPEGTSMASYDPVAKAAAGDASAAKMLAAVTQVQSLVATATALGGAAMGTAVFAQLGKSASASGASLSATLTDASSLTTLLKAAATASSSAGTTLNQNQLGAWLHLCALYVPGVLDVRLAYV